MYALLVRGDHTLLYTPVPSPILHVLAVINYLMAKQDFSSRSPYYYALLFPFYSLPLLFSYPSHLEGYNFDVIPFLLLA